MGRDKAIAKVATRSLPPTVAQIVQVLNTTTAYRAIHRGIQSGRAGVTRQVSPLLVQIAPPPAREEFQNVSGSGYWRAITTAQDSALRFRPHVQQGWRVVSTWLSPSGAGSWCRFVYSTTTISTGGTVTAVCGPRWSC